MNGIWIRSEDGKTLALVADLFIRGMISLEHIRKWILYGSTSPSSEWIVIAEYPSEEIALRQLDDIQKWMVTDAGTEYRLTDGIHDSVGTVNRWGTNVYPCIYDLRERKAEEASKDATSSI